MDAGRARVLRAPSPQGGAPPAELVIRARRHGLRALMDRAGVDLGPGRALLEADERQFAGEVVALLEAHRVSGEFDRLAVIATPRICARLRECLTDRLAALICLERGGDLVRLRPDALRAAVAAELAAPGPGGTA